MHETYQRIGTAKYDFGIFIAGSSKTADIEQSLVLGAHGPRSLIVIILKSLGKQRIEELAKPDIKRNYAEGLILNE